MTKPDDLEARLGKQAAALFNGDFILVETYSGHRSSRFDPHGAQHLLAPEAGDETLGAAILDALSRSRFLPLEDARPFLDPQRVRQEYAAWTQSLMTRYRYKTKRALFGDMIRCGIQMAADIITIKPARHDRLEGWGRTLGDGIEDVVIPDGSTAADVGAALRLGFSRCE